MFPANAKLRLLTPPSAEPLSLADAKAFLRLETVDDDAMVSAALAAARARCETIADRSFITRTYAYTLDFLPFAQGPYNALYWPTGRRNSGGSFGRVDKDDGSIFLPMPPLLTVQSLTYIDQSGVTQALDITPTANKVIVDPGIPGRIFAAHNTYFPFTQQRSAAVEIVYTAGYGPAPSDVPEPFIQAIKVLTAFLYENRSLDAPIPRAVEFLIDSEAGRSYA